MAEYAVFVSVAADKALSRLPDTVQRRIIAALDDLRTQPRPSGCVKLKGEENLWRIRVGDYRVIYQVGDQELKVLVVRIAHRKDAY